MSLDGRFWREKTYWALWSSHPQTSKSQEQGQISMDHRGYKKKVIFFVQLSTKDSEKRKT